MTLREQGKVLIEELEDLIDIIRIPGHRQALMVQEMRRALLSLELLEMDYQDANAGFKPSEQYATALISTLTMTRMAGWRAAAAYVTKENAL
jgi:hypothetical protein